MGVILNEFEESYKNLLRKAMYESSKESNRTGVNAYVLFNEQITFDFSKDQGKLPVITGKKIFFEKALGEFLWIFSGRTNVDFLHKYNVKWWDEYANEFGTVEKSYGYQMRYFNGCFDQINYCVNEIKKGSRRAVLTFWNPSDQNNDIPCCYTTMTFVEVGGNLNMKMDFRSSDLFLGLPYDFIVGALFLLEICDLTTMVPGKVTYSLANAHVYENHTNAVFNYLKRPIFELPLYYNQELLNYKCGLPIKAKMNN